jgi:hypothetical protein
MVQYLLSVHGTEGEPDSSPKVMQRMSGRTGHRLLSLTPSTG